MAECPDFFFSVRTDMGPRKSEQYSIPDQDRAAPQLSIVIGTEQTSSERENQKAFLLWASSNECSRPSHVRLRFLTVDQRNYGAYNQRKSSEERKACTESTRQVRQVPDKWSATQDHKNPQHIY